MFIELTKSSTGRRTKICVNSDHIQIIVNYSECQIGISGFESFIEVAESYDYVVDRLSTPLSATAPDMLEALEAVEEYLDGIADADQPSGCEHPIANEEMRLLVMVRAALAKARQ